MSKKPMFGCLCNALFCCSCSRRLEDKPNRSGRCSPRYCMLSPATIALALDALFLLSLVWVLFDAAQVMRLRYAWWWILPAGFAAPAMLVLLLKLRYVRRFCDVKWSEDIDWNARIVLVPLIGTLANTFMVSCWLLCAPLYVAELVRHNKQTSLDDFRDQTVALLERPSSILFMLCYVASVICSVLVSVRHRRVLLAFIRRMSESDAPLLSSSSIKSAKSSNNDDDDDPSLYEKADKIVIVQAPSYMAPTPPIVTTTTSHPRPTNAVNRDILFNQSRNATMERFDSMRSVPPSPSTTLRGVQVLPSFVPESNNDDDAEKSDSRVDSPRSKARRSKKSSK